MSEFESPPEAAEAAPSAEATPVPRKRPKPGERRAQILQTLAAMLEQPGAERITTAALAARLSVSEAALYRHFASKAQMFEAASRWARSSKSSKPTTRAASSWSRSTPIRSSNWRACSASAASPPACC